MTHDADFLFFCEINIGTKQLLAQPENPVGLKAVNIYSLSVLLQTVMYLGFAAVPVDKGRSSD